MSTLKGKVAVITGGNSGIGYATAKEMKKQGATVIITGRRKEAIEEAAKELGVIAKVADQANMEAIAGLAASINEEFGNIDILFINAGITGKSEIKDATEALWNSVVDINLKGAYFTLSHFIRMINDGGSVVFLSSIVATRTIAGSSIYALSKAAINSVVQTAALELAPRNIRVNAVSPGPTETGVFDKMGLDDNTKAAVKNALQQKIPLKQIGHPDDVAAMVIHLCSDAAKFITGAEVKMDGGMTIA